MLRSSSPGRRTLEWLPVTKSTTGTVRGAPRRGHSVQTLSSAAVSEIIGPAGRDMQRFPPIVATFEILNEARKALQHAFSSGNAFQPPSATVGGWSWAISAMRQVAANVSHLPWPGSVPSLARGDRSMCPSPAAALFSRSRTPVKVDVAKRDILF